MNSFNSRSLHLKLGTRGSVLARRQSEMVSKALKTRLSEIEIEEVVITTKGDKVTDVPLFKLGGQGAFAAELERALLDGRIDLAVHSLKDLPHSMPQELCLAAVSAREDFRDALVSKSAETFENLPSGARIGTSSLRRKAQLIRLRADLQFLDCRGNIDTRLRKLETGGYDAIIVAAAGLKRLNLTDRITEFFSIEKMIPAAGQGMLAVQCRSADFDLIELLKKNLNDEAAYSCAIAERTFLKKLNGGCKVPIGAFARMIAPKVMSFTAFVASINGDKYIESELVSKTDESPSEIGMRAAEELLQRGAEAILAECENLL